MPKYRQYADGCVADMFAWKQNGDTPVLTCGLARSTGIPRKWTPTVSGSLVISETVAEEVKKVVVEDAGDAEQNIRVDRSFAEDFVDISTAAWQLF